MTEENEIKEYFNENEWNTMSEAEKSMFTKFSVTVDVFSSEEVKVKEEPIDDDDDDKNGDDQKVLDATGSVKDEPTDVNKCDLLDVGEHKIFWNEGVQNCKDECEEKFVKNEPNGQYIVNFQPLLVVQNGVVVENEIEINESPKETVNKIYSCWKCCYKSTSKHNYTLHLYKHNAFRQLVQSGKELFKCNLCEFVTNQLADIHTHVRIKHNEEQQIIQYTYKCNICNKLFKTNFARKSHMLTHSDDRKFHCTYCDYKAKRKGHLTDHLKIKHSMGKAKVSHKCSQCSYETNYKQNFNRHLIKHSENPEKKFKCPQCDYQTNHKPHLTGHLVNKHISGKDYKCSKCPYQTNVEDCLKTHLLQHHKPRTYKCKVCCKRFKRGSELKKHYLSHGGEKRFNCTNCEFKTNEKRRFTKHLKTKHKEEKQ